MPTVSVVIPSYNRLRFLTLAVASVLAQTCTDWELIIVDDGSEPDTLHYLLGIRTDRVRVLQLVHTGNPGIVRNAGIEAATGRYIAFLDSDDLWMPEKLTKQLCALRAAGDSRWSYTGYVRLAPGGGDTGLKDPAHLPVKDGWIFEPLLRLQTAVPMPSLLAEKALLEEVGGFDPQLPYGEFHDLALRLALTAKVAPVDEPLCALRSHDEHYSRDRDAADRSWTRLYHKFACLAPSAALRSFSSRMRALCAVRVAGRQASANQHMAAVATLIRSAPFSWRYAPWWAGLLALPARAARKSLRRLARR